MIIPYPNNTAWQANLFGSYLTKTFAEVWGTAESFVNDVKASGVFPVNDQLKDETLTQLYYMLYARYGNSHMKNSDENQFKYRVYTLIYAQGYTWEKRTEIQALLRNFDEDTLRQTSTYINNHSYNPSTPPTTDTTDPLPTIDAQDANHQMKGKMEAYGNLLLVLQNDITTSFLDTFKPLFLTFVQPQAPLWYMTDIVEPGDVIV